MGIIGVSHRLHPNSTQFNIIRFMVGLAEGGLFQAVVFT
jgi:hypothetical protein